MDKVTVTTSYRQAENDRANETREFDAFDNKGRRFGARATTYSIVYGPAEQVETWNYPSNVAGHAEQAAKADTTRYAFRPHALRDGKPYGASHSEQQFATEAKRDAAVAKYFAQAEKRALANKARAS
jgi:hypothetical protein